MNYKRFMPLLAVMIFSGCAALGFPTLEEEALTADQRVISEAQANEIVRQAFQDKNLIYQDPAQNQRMSTLLNKLGRAAGISQPFQVRLYQDTQANAFSIGGKYVYISSTMLSTFGGDENLIAGVLGHEIAHDIAGHQERQQTAQYWQKMAATLIKKAGSSNKAVGTITDSVSALAALKYSRSQEKEADILGTVYAYRAGYDPQGLIRFFEKTNSPMTSSKVVSIFSTHPYHPSRIETIQTVMRYLRREITLTQVEASDRQIASVLRSLQKIDSIKSSSASAVTADRIV